MYRTDELPMVSLFTGAGGLDLGLERAGYTTRVAVEIDKWAHQTLLLNQERHYRRPFPVLWDITDAETCSPEKILEAAGLERGEAELLAGGPPCQSFSTAGRRGSIGDPRGGLFKNYAEVVAFARPRFFVFENVRGLLSAAVRHRPLAERGPGNPPLEPEEEQGSAWRIIRQTLEEELGYQIVAGLVDAADYGVPQNRVRLLVIGSRDHELAVSEINHFVVPTHRGHWKTLRDGLKGVTGEPEFLRYTPDRAALLEKVPAGANWRFFRDHEDYGASFTAEIMGGAWVADGGRVGFFRRLSWDKPSPTLPTSPIQKSTSLCHPEETRPLSVQEYAAIQQFPLDYEFAGGTAQKYKQIGNAVPLGLAEAVGQSVLSACDVASLRVQLRLMEGDCRGQYGGTPAIPMRLAHVAAQ